uniref:hypothetical protein n=1 Tax=Prevotella sp. TaxID=59823 RepID=UPI004026421F
MKKTYIKPQLLVMATDTNELLQQTSWSSNTPGKELGKDDYGKIIYDKGKENYEEDEYDPWKGINW